MVHILILDTQQQDEAAPSLIVQHTGTAARLMGHGQIEVIVKIKEELIIQDKNQSIPMQLPKCKYELKRQYLVK